MQDMLERETAEEAPIKLTGQSAARFDPAKHLVQLKGREGAKDYLPVAARLAWINDDVRQAVERGETVELTIVPKKVFHERDVVHQAEKFVWSQEKRRSEKVIVEGKGECEYQATIVLRVGGMVKRATANKIERGAEFPDYLEKAQTGAVGRALAMLGYGSMFAPELDEAHRVVDSPIGRGADEELTPMNAKQYLTLVQLFKDLGREVPDGLEDKSAKVAERWIAQMRGEHRSKQQNGDKQGDKIHLLPISELRKQCQALFPDQWDDVLLVLFKRVIPDDNFTPDEQGFLQRALAASMTPKQEQAIHQLCKELKQALPKDLASLSFIAAKSHIQMLEAQRNQPADLAEESVS